MKDLPHCLPRPPWPCTATGACADDLDKVIPAPVADPANTATSETAVLAGGCFWGQQGVFEHVKGVTKVVAGYSGGAKATATYNQVGTETTGHAESVEITFDPKQVSFGRLLQIYFSVAHDPTELNRQGPDDGTSYRSEIFAASPGQQETPPPPISPSSRRRICSRALSSPRSSRSRAFMPPRAITRTIWSIIRPSPISSSTTCPRSRR